MNMRELSHMPWFAFVPSTTCNLKCAYCSQVSVRTDKISADLLQDKALLDFIAQIPSTHLFISGGEPLILPGVKEFVNIAAGYGHKISFDTNLHIPDKKLEALLSYWDTEAIGFFNISHHMVCNVSLDSILRGVTLIKEKGVGNFVKYVGVPEMLPEIKQNMLILKDKGIGAAVTILYGDWKGRRMPEDYSCEEAIELLDLVPLHTLGLQLFSGIRSKGLLCKGGQDYVFYNMTGKDEVIPCCHGGAFPIYINETFFATGDTLCVNIVETPPLC